MTDLAAATVTAAANVRRRIVPTLAAGLAGGLVLGVVARAWMRLIADDPAFTWSGTLFVVAGFTIFGLTQSVVAWARGGGGPRWMLGIARVIGTVGILPLFVGAGALMAPTIVAGGFASARREWRTAARLVCVVVAAGPVFLVGRGLVGSFGWSLRTVTGFVAMIAVYGTIVRAARSTFAARSGRGRLRPRVKLVGFVVLGLVFVHLMVGMVFA